MIKLADNLTINQKIVGCNCNDWANSWPQIERSQVNDYNENGNTYTGEILKYCPWCGKKLVEIFS